MSEIINETNFDQYFFDVRRHGPKKEHILARFSAVAEFVEGQMKQHIIYLLSVMSNGAASAVQVMQKLGCATYQAALDLCIKIAEDLKSGLLDGKTLEEISKEVEKKVYSYHYEQFFYTKEEYVPKDSPHWDVIRICNLEEHLEKIEGIGEIGSKVIETTE